MKINKALIHSVHLLWCFRCCSIILQAAQADDIVLFLVQKETAEQVQDTLRTKAQSASHFNTEVAVNNQIQGSVPVEVLHILVQDLYKSLLLLPNFSDVDFRKFATSNSHSLSHELLSLRKTLQTFLELLIADKKLMQLWQLSGGVAQQRTKLHLATLQKMP